MIRRVSLVVAAGLLAGVSLLAADATVVLRNGERHHGRLSYNHDDSIELSINGQERSFPWSDVVVLNFSGDPVREDIAALHSSSNPPDLERHLLVTRAGERVRGKFHDILADDLSFHTLSGGNVDRRRIPMSEVARVYMNSAAARSMYANLLPGQGESGAPGGQGVTVQVSARQAWTYSGIIVERGERVRFSVGGSIQIAPTTTVNPDGDPNSPGRATYPVRTMNSGALVGRVGARTFPIGTRSEVVMPLAGRLELGINDDNFRDNNGAFAVTIIR